MPSKNSSRNSQQIKIPKWFRVSQRAKLKKELQQELMEEYLKPTILSNKQKYTPTKLDVDDYKKQLEKLSLKKLLEIGIIEDARPKFSLLDRVSKLKKRSSMLVTIYHKNGSRTHYVVSKHSRVLKINEHTYLCPPNYGNFDNKYGMMSYVYYENMPMPMTFDYDHKSMNAEVFPDGELLSNTLDFEFAQRLAQSKMSKKLDLALLFAALAFAISVIHMLLWMNNVGMLKF